MSLSIIVNKLFDLSVLDFLVNHMVLVSFSCVKSWPVNVPFNIPVCCYPVFWVGRSPLEPTNLAKICLRLLSDRICLCVLRHGLFGMFVYWSELDQILLERFFCLLA